MQFNLDAEQQLLCDSVARFVDNDYYFAQRSVPTSAGEGDNSDANWRTFAENGWLAACVPEAHGGVGGSVIETAIVSEQFGRGLIVEPYLGCAVLATQVLLAAATDAPSTAWLPSLCDGSRRLALAYSESASRGMPHYVATRAERDGTGYRLHGHKTLVLGAPGADGYIVSARTSGEARDADGISLFVVIAGDERLKVAPVTLHDGRAAAEVTLDGVRVAHPTGEINRGWPALQEGLSHAMLALGAELVGAMERTIEVTADYLRSRKQFGVPIATFQSLQHRMADMAAELELARSMLFAALASYQNDDVATRLEVLSGAKALITTAARNVCGQGIQLHGGIGLTEEYVVGHFFKRAVVADTLFGSSALHEAASAQALQTRLGTVGPAINRPARNLRAV